MLDHQQIRKSKMAEIGLCTHFSILKKLFLFWLLTAFVAVKDSPAEAAGHGISMHGAPELASDFTALPYVNAEAPKGGILRLGEIGSFDSLNPYILKGTAPWRLRFLTVESLLGRNWDEPFSLYGLLAESIEIAPDRSWISFTLRPEARFSDGSPVTVDDVIFSWRLLDEAARPPYRGGLSGLSSLTQTGPRTLRASFAEPDWEAPLILGLRPVLKRADLEARAFDVASLTPLIGSGPYVVDAAEPGRSITFRRDPDYWGRDLPLMRGQANFDSIAIEYFRDGNALWEAFKAGAIDLYNEGDPVRWATGYDFPRAASGDIVKAEIAHGRPSGLSGFVFNTRRTPFDDIRVREALTEAFDFEWMQKTMLAGAYTRTKSFFGGSDLAHQGAATGAERALLTRFAASLPDGALEGGIHPPVSAGDGRNRRGLRRAAALLQAAGWRVENGTLLDAAGAPFRFEILLDRSLHEATAGVFVEALKKLGIEARVRLVDDAQYQARLIDYDFDMIVHAWAPSLSPGVEQRRYWGGAEGRAPGSRNHAGVDSPAVDAAIAALTTARTEEALIGAARALDRALAAGRYVIPFWHAEKSWIAHDARLTFPERTPLYGDWLGFMPDVWWEKAP